MANSPLKDFASSILFGTTPGVTRPTVKAPNPFDNDDRMDISDRFRPIQDYSSSSSSSASQQSYSHGSTEGTDPYEGPLDVSGMTQSVADQFVGMPKGLGAALSPLGFNPFIAAGAGLSKKNLENIESKIAEGASGYSLGMLDGRIIGVSPNAFGGYSLSGVLPQGITDVQRRQLINNLLDLNPITELVGGKFNPDDLYSGYTKGTATDDMINIIKSGVPPEAAAYDYSEFFDDSGNAVSTPPPSEDDFNPSDPGGGGSSSQDFSAPTYDYDAPAGAFVDGGRVGMQMGGTASKDPVQSTGFVDGPPQNYAKGTTVADTENHRVRVGSFVLNAPTTERLQKEGKLPKGPQKRKAAKGGKMMEVALSKGEYVIDVDDINKFGGYAALNKENNKGKPEVERRQAAAQGGFLGGYSNGGNMTLPTPSPVRQAYVGEGIDRPEIPLTDNMIAQFKVYNSSKKQRKDVENLINALNDRENLALLALAETTAEKATIEAMMGVQQTSLNRIKSTGVKVKGSPIVRPDFIKAIDLKSTLKQRTPGRGSGSYMFQYDGLEPKFLTPKIKDVLKGAVTKDAITKIMASSENILDPETEMGGPLFPDDVTFYTREDASLAKEMELNPQLRYVTTLGGHDFYSYEAAPESPDEEKIYKEYLDKKRKKKNSSATR